MKVKSDYFLVIILVFLGLLLSACGGDDDGSVNGDQPGTIQFSQASYDVTEGTDGNVNIRVRRSDGADGAASVDFASAGGSAIAVSDYSEKSGTLNWFDGLSGNLTITIAITDDSTPEPAEAFTVTLSNASVASLGSNSTVTVNIIDDD